MPHVPLPNGLSTYYEFHRGGQQVNDLDPSKPTVVLIHAAFSSSRQWRKTVEDPRLNAAYNFVLFDAKHYGRTTGPLQEGYDFATGGKEIAMAVDELRIPPAHFVGETFDGCRRIVHLALDRPDLVLSLVLISPGPLEAECPEVLAELNEMKQMDVTSNGRQQAEGVCPHKAKMPRELANGLLAYFFSDTATQEIEEEEIAHLNEFHAGVNPSSVRESWQPMLEKGKIAGLENIQQPVMILRGSRNNSENAGRSCDAWRDALTSASAVEFHIVHGAPARCVTSLPLLVNRFLLGWLSKHAQGKPAR